MELTDTKHSSLSKQYLEFQRTGWMDGYEFTDFYFDDRLFPESCFGKVCDICLDLYIVCLSKLKWFTVTKPTMHKHSERLFGQ